MTIHLELLGKLGPSAAAAVYAFLESTHTDARGACSHGALDLEKLVRMLLQDVALAVHRPGSWEGANMRQVLASHGYTALDEHAACITERRSYWRGRDPYPPA